MSQGSSTAIQVLMSALEGVERALGPACEDNSAAILPLLSYVFRRTPFDIVLREEISAALPAAVKEPEIQDRRVPALPQIAFEDPEPAPKPAARKTLSQLLFEYVVLAILRSREGQSTGKSELLAALPRRLEFGNRAAMTTRLNKMSRATETQYIDWEKGKQKTPIVITSEGGKRLLQLEGTGSGSLSPEDKKFLRKHGGWFGPSLDKHDA